jgi:hypothetical protein
MRVDTALLCEAASARDGLLYVLGGGIVGTQYPEFPSELGMTLALRIMLHPTELTRPHQLEILLQDDDGALVTKVNVGIGIPEGTNVPPGDEAPLVLPWSFPGRPQLPKAGRYSFEILIDGVHQLAVPFTAALQQEVEQ